VLAPFDVPWPRTFSFAGSIAAVSWRQTYATSPGVGVDVAVLAEADGRADKIVCVLAARVERGARAEVLLDDGHLATFRLVRPTGYPRLPDDVYRHVARIPVDSVLDALTHTVSVVLRPAACAPGGPAIARVDTAFYARRTIAGCAMPLRSRLSRGA
jgi:hypothetical protein